MRSFILRTLLTAFALWVAVQLVPGLDFDFGSLTNWWAKFGVVLLIAVVFGLVNAIVKPIVQILSIPLYILTLGLIHIIINAFMLELTAWITNNLTHWGLQVEDFFWAAIFGSLVISAVSWLAAVLLPDKVENLYS
ncbi:phage holin family protein [Gordonia phosphorivorans]|uniref:Phage holin family protein n=1 Tax=Gordonia phosphorivorans TaxID=1056982 RepID=A0ABV6H527_9ACTN